MNKDDLRRIRTRMGMTQEALAKQLDKSVRQVKRWEAGETKIPKATEMAIRSLKKELGL